MGVTVNPVFDVVIGNKYIQLGDTDQLAIASLMCTERKRLEVGPKEPRLQEREGKGNATIICGTAQLVNWQLGFKRATDRSHGHVSREMRRKHKLIHRCARKKWVNKPTDCRSL